MRVAASILAMAATASAFAPMPIVSRSTTLSGLPEEISDAIAENQAKSERWCEIRLLSDEDAEAQLSGEELESFKAYHADNKADIVKMKGVTEMMLKSLELPKIQPKGKKQRKRDKFVLQTKIAAARAAEAAAK